MAVNQKCDSQRKSLNTNSLRNPLPTELSSLPESQSKVLETVIAMQPPVKETIWTSGGVHGFVSAVTYIYICTFIHFIFKKLFQSSKNMNLKKVKGS